MYVFHCSYIYILYIFIYYVYIYIYSIYICVCVCVSNYQNENHIPAASEQLEQVNFECDECTL